MKQAPVLKIIESSRLSGQEKYRLSFNRPIDSLVKSIAEVGQTAPLLCRKAGNGIDLFSGYRRRDALVELGKSRGMALVWTESSLSEKQALRMAFFENALSRGLNIIEQAMAAQKLSQLGIGPKEAARSYFQKVGLPGSVAVIEALVALNGLEEGWKLFIAQKQIGLRHASELCRRSAPERKALEILLTLGATASQFREVLEMAEGIGKRDQKSVAEILQAPELSAILKGKKFVPAQKLDLLIRELKKIRHPGYQKLYARHQSLLRKLEIPGEVKIEPADFFEAPEYKLELSIRKSSAAREIFQKLLAGAQSPDWEKLFETDDED